MTTPQHGHLGDPTTTLRRLAVAGVLVPLLALGACSGEDAVTSSPTAPAGATTAPGTSTGSSTTSSVPTTSDTPSATATRTDTKINATIKDPVLGHTITAVTLSRSIPWPAGNPVSAANFEIVGVSLHNVAGKRYSATIDPTMFSLQVGPTGAFVAPTTEFGTTFGTPLATAKRGETKDGWLFFKIDKGSTGPVVLKFQRPSYKVTTTNSAIPAQAFTVKLSG
ncbi:hypothetical protein N865_03500 [Intrasporangium oryzae NRRL B-24470]|uniref:DUF4352 domain-containing protein n=1 Tax=Intrasporangium oryzae NRRL B-24470 TaxID=1386089 RepID=W9GCR0_9MICO|nr:hypothetical protein N865_03500 [Intrasporangium oryzae NRRL B-24470]